MPEGQSREFSAGMEVRVFSRRCYGVLDAPGRRPALRDGPVCERFAMRRQHAVVSERSRGVNATFTRKIKTRFVKITGPLYGVRLGLHVQLDDAQATS